MVMRVLELKANVEALDICSRSKSATLPGPLVSFACPGTPNMSGLEACLQLMEDRMKELTAKVNPNKIALTSLTMDSEEDLLVWVKKYLLLGAFGVLVDPWCCTRWQF
jgi:hypothetical protein